MLWYITLCKKIIFEKYEMFDDFFRNEAFMQRRNVFGDKSEIYEGNGIGNYGNTVNKTQKFDYVIGNIPMWRGVTSDWRNPKITKLVPIEKRQHVRSIMKTINIYIDDQVMFNHDVMFCSYKLIDDVNYELYRGFVLIGKYSLVESELIASSPSRVPDGNYCNGMFKDYKGKYITYQGGDDESLIIYKKSTIDGSEVPCNIHTKNGIVLQKLPYKDIDTSDKYIGYYMLTVDPNGIPILKHFADTNPPSQRFKDIFKKAPRVVMDSPYYSKYISYSRRQWVEELFGYRKDFAGSLSVVRNLNIYIEGKILAINAITALQEKQWTRLLFYL